MIHALERIIGKAVPYVLAERREGDPDTLVATNEKARRVLGWEARYSDIEEILSDVWNWENARLY